jgi:alkylation response protein AidB-like acyl-CoA dehydrogenase
MSPGPELPTLRRNDYSLSDVREALRETFAQLFTRECPISLVRSADPLAFDAGLWRTLNELNVPAMTLSQADGGDGAELVDLVLVLEERGYRIAPVPLVEHAVGLRTLASLGATDALARFRSGSEIVTLAPVAQRRGVPGIVPNAPIAGAVIGLLDDELVIVEPERSPLLRTIGGSPLGRVDLGAHDAGSVLATGGRASAVFARAVLEWKTLVAASLVGLARGALDIAVAYAKERVAFGVPIGTFQALSHPLADVRIAIEGARRLVWRAAWHLDHAPDRAAFEVLAAYVHACETATFAVSQAIHTQGGLGFTLESDLHLYFRRAKSWCLVGGDPRAELAQVADLVFGPSSGGASRGLR